MEKLKKSYSLEDLHLEMLEKLMIHPSPAYRRSVFNNSYLTEEHLKTMSLNDPDLHIRKECKEELEKRFGIKEPNNSFFKARKIDLAIVPVVGIDKLGKRIGFGKGMYDRFFDSLNYKPTTVFTQLVLCKSEKILSDNYDIQANYIITN